MSEAGVIPQPRTYGPLGNLPLIDSKKPTLSLGKLAEEYGPIYRITLPGFSSIIVSGHDLVAEICDESRFDKSIKGDLENVRAFGGDGLFTSHTDEPNWQKAHRILLPTFSQQAMKGYHAMMVDIASQLIQKWARLNPNESIDVAEDMTRLTLDTIGLCGFNYRFNSFYRETPSPFINSMVRALNEAMLQSGRLKIQNLFMVRTRQQFNEDIQTMFSLVDKIIEERKANGDWGEIDLLARMLNGKDPETGETLDDKNIRYQIITFLIAGHETTSGLLSFALYFLLKHPDVLQKAYLEADRVLTDSFPSYSQVLQLHYIRMILNESLRLWPTAPGFELYAKEDMVIGGKYRIRKGEGVGVLLPQLHRDKAAWGADADEFRPERFEDPGKIPNHAYKPFGNGQRACIGMQFALHEATLVLGMILRHFELVDHMNYRLDVKQTLTLKPGDFHIRVRQRHKTASPAVREPEASHSKAVEAADQGQAQANRPLAGAEKTSLLVLYGSNLGTAEGIARELSDAARSQGFRSEAAPLNDWAGGLPKDGAVLIVTASYNGKPPGNAREFVKWLEGVQPGELQGVRYAVFGCGDRSWSNTYQDVPRWIDEQLARKGAARLSVRGEADAGGDFEKQLDEWRVRLWSDLRHAFGLERDDAVNEKRNLHVRVVSGLDRIPLAQTYEAVYASVTDNRELRMAGSSRSTRHLELALPEGITYREGDLLGVLPSNSPANVGRILRRYGLRGSHQLIVTANGKSLAHLPVDRPVGIHELLSRCVELQEAVTREQLRELAAYTVCPPHKHELEAMAGDSVYEEQILKKRMTMLDLLEKYEACQLPFERLIELLPPLQPRYYFISSSPQVSPRQISVAIDVVQDPAWSGCGEYRGAASNHLAECRPGEEVLIFIRTSEAGLRLPEDPTTPIIMVGTGTGAAAFRGFLQGRTAIRENGAALGEAHLYIGCRNEADSIYREDLERYDREDVVTLHQAFSHAEGKSSIHVQHLLERHASNLMDILDRGGCIFVCGDEAQTSLEVESALQKAYRTVHGAGEQEAKAWLERLRTEGRYAKEGWGRVHQEHSVAMVK
ncbi:bifunctional cytochrome P450/NADPH--P450 reductase [Paenibacillus sp. MZ04-78.2]|uniref:bifunctional cytochrome P450/NADPH--P450 reductase n=1 Tax=Paenibacillus sp. MZ04-78.2 TaxID=2962034 RepID=UPI0020B81DCE|nr:bifunctional cytochrome P450/NADPH--P450 reductase [Paenibacillus sp. MZ04-78.2]MCP3774186.1 bifunctional cytochrome P450/NADPH--P450 reductase [Paenibacillus sp. MZ04-78.2]